MDQRPIERLRAVAIYTSEPLEHDRWVVGLGAHLSRRRWHGLRLSFGCVTSIPLGQSLNVSRERCERDIAVASLRASRWNRSWKRPLICPPGSVATCSKLGIASASTLPAPRSPTTGAIRVLCPCRRSARPRLPRHIAICPAWRDTPVLISLNVAAIDETGAVAPSNTGLYPALTSPGRALSYGSG